MFSIRLPDNKYLQFLSCCIIMRYITAYTGNCDTIINKKGRNKIGRREDLAEFMDKYDNVSYNKANVSLILTSLKKAEENGCLRQFFLNEKPYQSAFTFFVFNDQQKAARGKDQIAIVFALNLYGAEHPGFAAKANALLKELACGSSKEAQSVIALMRPDGAAAIGNRLD